MKRVLARCESESGEESLAEDEEAWEDSSQIFKEIPNELVPTVRELLAKRIGETGTIINKNNDKT